MSRPVTLPQSLQDRFASLAARTRRVRAMRGACLVLLFLTVTAGVAIATDYFLELSALVRQAVLIAWVGVGFGLVCLRLCLPICRRLDNASLAAAVEQTYSGLHERLSSTVTLAGKDDIRHGAPGFVAMLIDETEQAAGPLDFPQAVPWKGILGLSSGAAVALLLLVSPALAWPAEYGDLAHRFLLPWSELSPYLFTITPGDVTAARGSSVTVEAIVRPRSSRIRLPASATLVLTDESGSETAQRMRVDRSDAFSLPLTVTADGQYRIEARASAGASVSASPSYRVTAVMPVELMPDSPTITITPPDYARGTRDEETLSGLVDLIALQTSLVRFQLHFTRPAVAARIEWAGADSRTKIYPLLLGDDNRSAELTLPAMTTGRYRIDLEAEHGVRTLLEGGTLTVKADLPPAVMRFTGREDLKAITPYDHLELECQLVDDVGVAKAAIEYQINDNQAARVPFSLVDAGKLEASGQLSFALEGKTREGDTLRYRLRVEDNYPQEFGGPHVVYAPADHWLTLKVVRQPGPVREQEIAAERDAIDRRIEAVRQALLQEMRGLYKLKLESRIESSLLPEQRDALGSLEKQNQSTEKALREMGNEADATPILQPLAAAARDIADREMQQSEAALHAAGAPRLAMTERDGKLKEADERLDDALKKLDALKKQNEQLAKDRADQLRFEALADKEQKLAGKAAELAKQESDPAMKEQAEQLQHEQAETAKELQRLAEESPTLRKLLDNARAEQAKEAAERARALADQQWSLTKARAETDDQRNTERLADLADRQRQLADKAARFAEETKQAARSARVPPLRPDDARRAADDLKEGNAQDALRHQEQLSRDLERLADGLDRAMELSRDPREAARQLARLQDDLRQRVQDEMHRKNAERPLGERLAELIREEEAIRKASQALSVPADDPGATKDRQTAVDEAARAAEMLRHEDARPALGPMEQTKRALEDLTRHLPSLGERQQQALRAVGSMRQDQDDIAKQTEQATKDLRQDDATTRESAKQKLTDAAKQQAQLADKLGKLDAAGEEGQRDRAAKALTQARDDLEKAPSDKASASQQQAKQELEKLEQALSGRKPADDATRNSDAKPQADDDRSADGRNDTQPSRPTGLPSKARSEQARQLAREERELRNAVRKAANEDRADKAPPRPDPLGELAKQQAEVARQSQELARDVTQGQGDQSALSRLGESASHETREAAKRMQNGELPAAQQAGKQAAGSLRQLAEDLARTPRGASESPDKDLLRQARDLARRQEEINQKTAAQGGDTDNRLARQQARQQEIHQQAGELEKDLNNLAREMNGTPPAGRAARQAASAAHEAQQRMSRAENGDPAQARQSQEQAARSLDRAAQQAARAGAEHAAACHHGDGQPGQGPSQQAGQSMRQAREQMDEAQGQLGRGQAAGARQSMENAARSLRQTASQLAQGSQANSPGNPDQSSSPGLYGMAPGGRPDPSVFGPGISKFAGKTWGELPGELRTKIVQDMKASYGEDYARLIKLYFEQLADTKRTAK